MAKLLIEQLCEICKNQVINDKELFDSKIIEINKKIILCANKGYTSFKIIVGMFDHPHSVNISDEVVEYTYIISTRKSMDMIIDMITDYYKKEGLNVIKNITYGSIDISWSKAADEAIANICIKE